MPTRPRIDIAGYHHIVNRGVHQMNIFRHNEDKDILALNDTYILWYDISTRPILYSFGIGDFSPMPMN